MTDIDRLLLLAEREMEAGNLDVARSHYLQVLSFDGSHPGAMLQISYVESLAGNYRAAREWALRVDGGAIERKQMMLELIWRLRTFNAGELLRDYAKRLLVRPDAPHEVLVECARQLSNLNDFGIALVCAESASRIAPDDLAARLVHGQLLAHHGLVEEASAEFEGVLARNPRIALAWWLLARLHRQTLDSNHVAQLQTLLATPGLQARDAAVLARALHKELDDLGDYQGAWHALEVLCKAKRQAEPYDPLENRKLVDALMGWAGGNTAAASPPAGRTPVFILGMYRSGTTLLEQLLDANPRVRGLGELNDFASAMRYATNHYSKSVLNAEMVKRAAAVDLADVGKRYLDSIAWRLGDEPFFTDKLPSNFLNIGFICHALPQAKILHMVRDPVETCFSNLRELFTGVNAYSYDQLELADYFIQYRRLMAHWHAAYPGRILDVDYAELTRDPEAVMRKVAGFCGIDYTDAMRDPRSSTRAVATASAVQVRDRVVRREVPKWAPYAKQLQPLISALRRGGVEIPELPA